MAETVWAHSVRTGIVGILGHPSMNSIVLASGSATRARLLEGARVDFEIDAASVDETEIKAAMRAESASAGDVAEALAEVKAMRVSRRHPGRLVIGADQMLDAGNGVWLDKPPDRDHARAQLQSLRGRSHTLIASVVAVRDEARLWHQTDRVTLTVRSFSDGFLDGYLDRMGDEILSTVGGYQLEGPGAQLFDRIEGDYFTVLGLPLLPLLSFLRAQRLLEA